MTEKPIPTVQESSYINELGQEVNCPDPTCEMADAGDIILHKILQCAPTIQRVMRDHGYETIDEANDFDVDGDFEDQRFEDSPYMKQEVPESIDTGQLPPEPESGSEATGTEPSTGGLIDAQSQAQGGAAAGENPAQPAPK